jgi:transcriptional regulator with XRE-family HTH domain
MNKLLEINQIFTYHRKMSDNIKERIKQVRETFNISQRDFSKKIYISQTLLGDIELGNRNVNDRTIELIVNGFNVNKKWLLTGKGKMFASPPPDPQLDKLIDIFNQLDKSLKNYLLDHSKSLLKIQKEKLDK